MGGEGGEGNCLVYCKYVRTYVHMYDTIGPILGHAHSSWHMHYTCYSLNVHLGRVSASYTVKLCICPYNMLWSVTVEQIVAWCGSCKCESIYAYIDMNISCIYSGGEGRGKPRLYICKWYICIYLRVWESACVHVTHLVGLWGVARDLIGLKHVLIVCGKPSFIASCIWKRANLSESSMQLHDPWRLVIAWVPQCTQ